MSLELRYQNTGADFLAQDELIHGDAHRKAIFRSNLSGVWGTVSMLLAAFVAGGANQPFMACLFLTVGGIYLFQTVQYPKSCRTQIETAYGANTPKQILLLVQDDGLHETCNGIESFVPWASIKSYTTFREILFIELVNSLWAIVPRRDLAPSPAALDGLIAILKQHQVPELESAEQVCS